MTASKTRPPIVYGESNTYPVLPLRDIVVFPHMIVPLFVGREKSIKALEEVMKNDGLIMLATQKNASDDDPSPDSIYELGTLASVLQLLKLPDNTVKVLVEGLSRAKVGKYIDRSEFYEATRDAAGRYRYRQHRGGSARALGRLRVRKLREAEQEDFGRSRRRRSADQGFPEARRHRRLASCGEDSRIARAFSRRCPSPSAWKRCWG